MIATLLLLSILGTISLVELLGSWLYSGEITKKHLIIAGSGYFFTMSIFLFGFLWAKYRDRKLNKTVILKNIIFTTFSVALSPGAAYFPEAYNISTDLYALGILVSIIFIGVVKFIQFFSDEDMIRLKKDLRRVFNRA